MSVVPYEQMSGRKSRFEEVSAVLEAAANHEAIYVDDVEDCSESEDAKPSSCSRPTFHANPKIDIMIDVLDTARDICTGSRHDAYGRPDINHGRTACMWSAFLGIEITPRQVCYMNILQKCSREAHWSQRDNDIDICGYGANAAVCME